MDMYTKAFNTLREAVDFVNEEGITKERLVSILPEIDGTFAVIYYEEQ